MAKAIWPIMVLTLAPAGLAQNPYGRITGRVVDSANAVVSGAAIRVVRLATNVTTAAVSNQEGNYEVLNLVPGTYSLSVEHQGFKRFERNPVEVRLGDILNLEVRLELGAITESVTVRDEAPMLESATAGLGMVIDNRRIVDLPLAGGSITYSLQLMPGISSTNAPTHGWLPQARDSQNQFAVAGARTFSSEYTLDGIPNMTQNGVMALSPPPEMIQEVKVQTAAYDATVGHFTGAHINMVLRSGTNQFHGNLYFSHNSRPLMSRPFFVNKAIYDTSTGPPTKGKIDSLWPSTRTNRYRGYAGGPVWIPKVFKGKDRTFWTYGADFMLRLVPITGFSTVPTLKERTGDLSALLGLGGQYQIYDPATIAPAANGRFSRLPLTGNIIPPSRLSPIAQKLLIYYPDPNASGTADGRNNFTGQPPNRINYASHLGRIDHAFSQNHRMYVSVSRMFTDLKSNVTFNNIARGVKGATRYTGLALDDVMTLRPDLVLNMRYGVTRLLTDTAPLSVGFDLGALGLAPSLVQTLDPELTSMPEVAIDQFTSIGSNSGTRSATVYHTLAANATHIRGVHSLRFGGEFRIIQENNYDFGYLTPRYDFGTDWTRGPLDSSAAAPIGQGLAGFLLGLPTSGYTDRNASYAEQSSYAALFLHDDWKISRTVTLNLGLRWEVELPTTERYNRTNRGFDFATANPVQDVARTNYARAPIAELPASQFNVLGGLRFAAANNVPRGLWERDGNNLAPRIGLAWSVRPSMVVRAGYGIFFESLGADRADVSQQGFSQRTTLVPSNNNGVTFRATLQNPFPDGVLAPAGASAGLKTFLGRAVTFFSPGRKNGYMQRWSLGVQREFPHRVLVEVGYLGNRGTGIGSTRDYNPVPGQFLSRSPLRDQATINLLTQAVASPFAGIADFTGTMLQSPSVQRNQLLRPFPQFDTITTAESAGFSWYHSTHVRAEKRFGAGYTVTASYTWSKFMEAIEYLNPFDLHPHHVVSPQDRPHHVALSGIWELPVGRGRPLLDKAGGVVNHLLGGWSIQAMWTLQSGPPLNFGNILFYGDVTRIALPRSSRALSQWFNTGAGFERDSRYQLDRNVRAFPLRLTGPRSDGYNSWDLSLFKNIRIGEKLTLQLRAEGQDALNNAMFAAPNTVPTNALFGQVTNTVWSEQRRITVGTRLSW